MSKIQDFNSEDYPDAVCCGILEHMVLCGYKFPFQVPILINRPGMELEAKKWSVSFYGKDLRSSGLNQRDTVSMFLVYCPFCGEKIGEG